MNDSLGNAVSQASRRARHLRIAGVSILILGLIGAAFIYWLKGRSADLSGDPSMQSFNKAHERQMGILYGKQGAILEDIDDSLSQPGTQAVILGTITIILAGICFYFACLSDLDDDTP